MTYIMRCKYEGSGVWAGRCAGTKEIDPCPGHDKCKRFKPDYKTNADRIRAMTDEELAWELMEFRFDGFGKAMGGEAALPDTQMAIFEWLKQPCEEET